LGTAADDSAVEVVDAGGAGAAPLLISLASVDIEVSSFFESLKEIDVELKTSETQNQSYRAATMRARDRENG
jgi:hypothetical protein